MAEQFRDLQLKQKERFKTRVAKLHSNSKSPQLPVDLAADRVLSDDLGLMTATQERENRAPMSSRTPGADNTTLADDREEDVSLQNSTVIKGLRQRVEQLQLQKADLASQLRTAKKRVAALQKTLQEALGDAGIATTQKIVELSKKNRLLHAELAAERNHSRQVEKQVKEAVAVQQEHVQEARLQEDKGHSTEAEQNLQSQLTSLQEQLAQSKHKTTDYRNQCQILKQDLKLAHKVIAKEVGAGVTVSALLNSLSGWRGRSQQIITLQNKLFEMKNMLEKTSGTNEMSDARLESVNMCSSKESVGKVEARQKAALEKMERERKQNLETTRKELERTQTECAQVHKECNALRARNKTLTEDMKLLKSKRLSLKRNGAMPDENRHLNTCKSTEHALELKVHELEQVNQLLKQQLQECKKQVQKSRQNSLRPSTTRSEVPSLPPLQQQPLSGQQARTRSFPIRETSSAHQPTVKHTLREAQVLAQIAEAERDKLLHLTLTLQQRLDSTADQLMRLQMEKNVGHKLPSFGRSGTNNGVKQKPRSDAVSKIEALEVEMAIQRDENAVLKETLRQLRQEKLEDARLFHATLQDTKKTCIEIMRGKQH